MRLQSFLSFLLFLEPCVKFVHISKQGFLVSFVDPRLHTGPRCNHLACHINELFGGGHSSRTLRSLKNALENRVSLVLEREQLGTEIVDRCILTVHIEPVLRVHKIRQQCLPLLRSRHRSRALIVRDLFTGSNDIALQPVLGLRRLFLHLVLLQPRFHSSLSGLELLFLHGRYGLLHLHLQRDTCHSLLLGDLLLLLFLSLFVLLLLLTYLVFLGL
mmetsp:Transcript_29103/g.40195  ORF Transcript_29103/g.40195 Transcript_29103/m.40195 type:complete len:216 (-) Transcript_29103:1213-1860(-)